MNFNTNDSHPSLLSSKRNQRSKNKADSNNNINFVFKPDESLNRGLSFTGSVPGSPAAGSFNLGGNTMGTNNAQSFTFGSPTAQPTGNSAFNFAAPSTLQSPSSLKRGASENPIPGTPEHNSLRRTASEISFGNNAPSNNSPFTFGSSTPSGSEANQLATPTGGFNLPSSSANSSNTPAFAFSAVNSSATTAQPTSTPSAFTFGTPNPPSTTTPTQSTQTSTASPFTFGSTPEAPKTATNSAFAFGKSTEPSNTTSQSAFTFGKPAAAPAATTNNTTTSAGSPFTFGKPADATPKASTAAPSFTFGQPAQTTSKPTETPTLSFGKPADTNSKTITPAKPTTENAPASASTFTFGTPVSAPSKPAELSFGATATTATSTVTSASTSTVAATVPTFTFGSGGSSSSVSTNAASAASTTTATPVPTFTFGASEPKKGDEKKDASKTSSIVTSSPFTFGSTATAPGAVSGSTTASLTTATPLAGSNPTIENKPNPFSFTKVLEDLSKVATQQPNQMYASLITPSLASLYQNQIVQQTNFRIDNISSSTRFTELPEQAQKELDELEKYVRLEGQRSDHIKNHGAPQQLQKMEACKRDTESLSQKSDALSSMFKSRLESTQSLFDTVREQLRHANDGCAIIEACKHPGTSRRWLFGHSDEDDYFPLVAKELTIRMEEYKNTIWEIERTAESWSKNRAQSPQDIARIMHSQNETFLALANRVVSLHERVDREKTYYKQYLQIHK